MIISNCFDTTTSVVIQSVYQCIHLHQLAVSCYLLTFNNNNYNRESICKYLNTALLEVSKLQTGNEQLIPTLNSIRLVFDHASTLLPSINAKSSEKELKIALLIAKLEQKLIGRMVDNQMNNQALDRCIHMCSMLGDASLQRVLENIYDDDAKQGLSSTDNANYEIESIKNNDQRYLILYGLYNSLRILSNENFLLPTSKSVDENKNGNNNENETESNNIHFITKVGYVMLERIKVWISETTAPFANNSIALMCKQVAGACYSQNNDDLGNETRCIGLLIGFASGSISLVQLLEKFSSGIKSQASKRLLDELFQKVWVEVTEHLKTKQVDDENLIQNLIQFLIKWHHVGFSSTNFESGYIPSIAELDDTFLDIIYTTVGNMLFENIQDIQNNKQSKVVVETIFLLRLYDMIGETENGNEETIKVLVQGWKVIGKYYLAMKKYDHSEYALLQSLKLLLKSKNETLLLASIGEISQELSLCCSSSGKSTSLLENLRDSIEDMPESTLSIVSLLDFDNHLEQMNDHSKADDIDHKKILSFIDKYCIRVNDQLRSKEIKQIFDLRMNILKHQLIERQRFLVKNSFDLELCDNIDDSTSFEGSMLSSMAGMWKIIIDILNHDVAKDDAIDANIMLKNLKRYSTQIANSCENAYNRSLTVTLKPLYQYLYLVGDIKASDVLNSLLNEDKEGECDKISKSNLENLVIRHEKFTAQFYRYSKQLPTLSRTENMFEMVKCTLDLGHKIASLLEQCGDARTAIWNARQSVSIGNKFQSPFILGKFELQQAKIEMKRGRKQQCLSAMERAEKVIGSFLKSAIYESAFIPLMIEYFMIKAEINIRFDKEGKKALKFLENATKLLGSDKESWPRPTLSWNLYLRAEAYKLLKEEALMNDLFDEIVAMKDETSLDISCIPHIIKSAINISNQHINSKEIYDLAVKTADSTVITDALTFFIRNGKNSAAKDQSNKIQQFAIHACINTGVSMMNHAYINYDGNQEDDQEEHGIMKPSQYLSVGIDEASDMFDRDMKSVLNDNMVMLSIHYDKKNKCIWIARDCKDISINVEIEQWDIDLTTKQFTSIIEESQELTKIATEKAAMEWSKEQKNNWWNSRISLNNKLRDLIEIVNSKLGLIGRSMVCPLIRGSTSSSKVIANEIIEMLGVEKIDSPPNDRSNLKKTATKTRTYSKTASKKVETKEPISNNADEFNTMLLVINYLVIQNISNSSSSSSSSLTSLTQDLAKFTLNDADDEILEQELDQYLQNMVSIKIPVKNGADLIRSVKKYTSVIFGDALSSQFKLWIERSNILLSLSKQIQFFPWESLPILSCQAVSRVPSALMAIRLIRMRNHNQNERVKMTKGTYLIDPEKNLSGTRNTMKEYIDQVSKCGQEWFGCIGSIPTKNDFLDLMTGDGLYLYCGHGNGEQFFPRENLKRSKRKPKDIMLLMGCSSARHFDECDYDPESVVTTYLQYGTSNIIGNLWDVTDKDTDAMTIHLLKEISNNSASKRKELVHLLPQARELCKLKYLNGSALVSYGIPLHID